MHTVTRLASVAALLLACGCGSDTSQESADCSQQIEHQGIRYIEHGFPELQPVEFERVVAVPCLDTGDEPKPDAPTEYRSAYQFTDHDPSEVLAVEVEDGLYRVMLSDSLSDSRASSILRALGVE